MQAAAKASAEKLKTIKAQLQASKDKIKEKSAEVAELKTKFRKHRHRHPEDKLTKRFSDASSMKKGKLKDDEMARLLEEFSRVNKGSESVSKSVQDSHSPLQESGERTLNYAQVCAKYHLQMHDEENNNKLQIMVDMKWIRRKKISKKEREKSDSLGLPEAGMCSCRWQ